MQFVPDAALIALREGLEALLITGVLLLMVTRLGRPDARRYIWLGFGAAALTSVIAGWLVSRYLLVPFEERGWGDWFELIAALLAVVTLTYMAFWMWSHTNQVLAQVKKKVRVALTTGALATIVFLAYVSVLREGLETVLFYSALSARADWGSILASGAIGFVLSGVLVFLILTGAKKIDTKTFMTATGFFLLIIAAMLLTHVVHALIGIGALPAQRAIWDTTAFATDDSAVGRILHATFGYTATPTLLEAILYFGFLFIAGGLFLWKNGAFTRSTPSGTSPRRSRIVVFGLLILLVTSGVAAAGARPTDIWVTGHDHGDGDHEEGGHHQWHLPEDVRVGVLLRSHGEPVEYNATTYQSFADFMRHLLVMLEMEDLLLVDHGTVLLDKDDPFASAPSMDPSLVDAWLRPYDLPAVYVGSPFPTVAQVPLADGYYMTPAGPGLGEPDILELAGLSAWQSWLQMENHSPMHFDKEAILDQVVAMLDEHSQGKIATAKAYHILPHVGPDETVADAARALLAQNVTHIVDAYTSHIHSDVMNACMMAPHAHHDLRAAGFKGPILEAGASGADPAFAEGIADHLAERLKDRPDDERVAVFLTHHGLDPQAESPCHEGPDPYNAQADAMFEQTKKALQERLGDDLLILQVYGQGADGDPDIYAPLEALDIAKDWGATRVLDLPYELSGNGYDNLVVHRRSYGFEPHEAPYYGTGYETQFTHKGLQVQILSSAIAVEARAEAQVHVIEAALEGLLEATPDDHGDEGHDHRLRYLPSTHLGTVDEANGHDAAHPAIDVARALDFSQRTPQENRKAGSILKSPPPGG